MTRHQRFRRRFIWGSFSLGALLWVALLILPAAIGGHITAEQPPAAVTSR